MRGLGFLTLVAVLQPLALAAADGEGDEFFERHVRPVLVGKCVECHGNDEPEAGLRLTSRAAVLQGGKSGAAAVAGKPEQSRLVAAVRQSGELKMPPEGRLRDDEIAALTKWVERGLPWPEPAAGQGALRGDQPVTDADREHWAFRPVSNPTPPDVRDVAWPAGDIDRFILARLEEAGLSPSPSADRRTLITRAYLDLIGLPPTWEEVQEFIRNDDPRALDDVIERLLSSPRYGERWGRHWLDVARYADTKDGVLMYGDDRVRPYAWTYRDYVIRALNADTPFDRFIHEQLAADRIEPAVEPWRLAAMGFLTLGRMYDNNIHDIIDDQIDTVTRGCLGLTVSCARCHDHKYDAIPTADYYSLYGVFAGSDAPLELPLIEPAGTSPESVEFEQQAAAKREEVRKFLDEQYALLSEAARERVGDYLVHAATKPVDPLETAVYFLSLAPEDLRPPLVARWRRFLEQRAVPDDPVFGPWDDLMEIEAPAEGERSFAVAAAVVVERWRSVPQGTDRGELNPLIREALHASTFNTRADVADVYGDVLKRVYAESKTAPAAAGTASAPAVDDARRQLLEMVAGRDSPSYFPKGHTRNYMSRQPKDAFGGLLLELDKMAVKSPHAPGRAMVLHDTPEPYEPRILVRGNATQPGRHVPRRFLEVLGREERTPFGNGSGRLDLAHAITAPDNPLTSRVIVNRVWMQHFGEPLVGTPSDFGTRSTPPTHPELLDHLATRFMAEGWSLKDLHRWILSSKTWQQSSAPEAGAAARGQSVDPENRLLWRAHRRRLEFEAMRDTLLAVSGRLTGKPGGRPVDVAGDPLCTVRTVYAMVDRQSLPGLFRAFDFAAPDHSVERRPRTMVPQQALFALNSPFMIEQARGLAARTTGAGDPTARVTALYRAAFARDPTTEEVADAVAFVEMPVDAQSQLSAWEQLAQVLLCSNELMYLD